MSPGQRKARLALLEQVIARKGSTSDFCAATGLTHTAAANWLRRNAPDRRALLQAERRHGPRPGGPYPMVNRAMDGQFALVYV